MMGQRQSGSGEWSGHLRQQCVCAARVCKRERLVEVPRALDVKAGALDLRTAKPQRCMGAGWGDPPPNGRCVSHRIECDAPQRKHR